MNFASSKFILALALMLGAMAFGDRATAQERLRVAWAGGASNATIWIVQEKGLLKKQGVNAEFISVNASPMALQAMIAGELDVIVTSVTTLVNSRLTGADVIMIASIVPTFPAHIVTPKSITDVKQLRGKIGGVGRAGTTTEIGMRLGLSRLGIDPNTDVKLVPWERRPTRSPRFQKESCNSASWSNRSCAKPRNSASSLSSTSVR
jgi:ABC-type nitrate/sulfonate/bicarbonate transport system substrate-binding protein